MTGQLTMTKTQSPTIIGSPPSLGWVSVSDLHTEPAYQRAICGGTSKRLIAGMVKQWDWSLCQPLIVSRRADGSLFIIDGQHRREGAVRRGDIPHLPCVILSGRDVKAEAAAFVALNTKRQRLSQFDIFNGMLAAGDEAAHATAAMIEGAGWRIRRSSATDGFAPGDLVCAPMLARACKKYGEAPVRNALTSLREAYPDTPVTNSGTLLGALILLFARNEVCDPDALIGALGMVTPPSDWSAIAAETKRDNPLLSRAECLARAMRVEADAFAVGGAA